MKKELEQRINAIDLANGGEGGISIEIKSEVPLDGATMYVVEMGIDVASFIVYEDGTLFCQDDWQGGHPETAEEISCFTWMTEDWRPAIMFDVMPRIMG